MDPVAFILLIAALWLCVGLGIRIGMNHRSRDAQDASDFAHEQAILGDMGAEPVVGAWPSYPKPRVSGEIVKVTVAPKPTRDSRGRFVGRG